MVKYEISRSICRGHTAAVPTCALRVPASLSESRKYYLRQLPGECGMGRDNGPRVSAIKMAEALRQCFCAIFYMVGVDRYVMPLNEDPRMRSRRS